MINSGRDSAPVFGISDQGLSMNFVGPYNLRLAFEGFVVLVGVLMLAGARQYRHRRLEWRPEQSL